MIITDYYRFEFLGKTKSKSRFDCVASTTSYNPFEILKNKENRLFVYIGDNTHTKAGQKGKADLAMTKGIHLSSIYRPDLTSNLGLGDVNNTADALLFRFTDFEQSSDGFNVGATIEIFIARGYRKDRQNLYATFADGELEDDVEAIIERANTTLY